MDYQSNAGISWNVRPGFVQPSVQRPETVVEGIFKIFYYQCLNFIILFSINKPWMCCDIVHEDDTICSSIIQVCYCPITFLSCCVPYLSSHLQRFWIILSLSLDLSWLPPSIVMIYLFDPFMLFVFKLYNSSVTLGFFGRDFATKVWNIQFM